MKKKGPVKRQHFVPRMILKRFSADERRISLLVLKSGHRTDDASLRDQCYRDYLYGEDQILEKSFAVEEGKIANLLGDMSPEHLSGLTPAQQEEFRAFVIYQKFRTPSAADAVNRTTANFVKAVMRETVRMNGGKVKMNDADEFFAAEDLDLIDVNHSDAQNEAIWNATISTPIWSDLAVKFLVTSYAHRFVISDHPVVAYNQFAEHHPIFRQYPTSIGLANKGLQLFMPISPGLTVAVFDPGTYEYGGRSLVCRAGPADVAFLNRMQVVNAKTCLYFDPRWVDQAMLTNLTAVRNRHPSIHLEDVHVGPVWEKGDGTMSQVIGTSQRQVRVGAKLSFVKCTNGHPYDGYRGASVPPRSWERVAESGRLAKAMEAEVKRRRADKATGPQTATEAQTNAYSTS